MALSSTVFGAGVENNGVATKKPKTVDLLESEIIHQEAPKTNNNVVVEEVELKGFDKETKRIIDKDAFKQSLLEHLNKNNDLHAESINNIDNIVNNIAAELENRDVSFSENNNDIGLYYTVISKGWNIEPYITSSQNWVSYSTSWLVEDNYRSSVPITITTTRTSTIKKIVGFTGSLEIKAKFNFSGEYEAIQTATVQHGAEIPAWTAWGTRPYIRYRTDDYYGRWYETIFYESCGCTKTWYYDKTGTNNVLTVKANEYWSVTNSTKNPSASTPSPPSGAPK